MTFRFISEASYRQVDHKFYQTVAFLGMIVMSFQDLKLCEKQISLTFSYFLINSALLYHSLANLLAHNKKMTEKSVFLKASSPEMMSQKIAVDYIFAILISTLWVF